MPAVCRKHSPGNEPFIVKARPLIRAGFFVGSEGIFVFLICFIQPRKRRIPPSVHRRNAPGMRSWT